MRAGDPNPYPNYQWLRENQPVCRMSGRNSVPTTWLVTSYEDVRSCLADPRLSYDDRNSANPPTVETAGPLEIARGMLDLDTPEHTRLRKLVSGVLRPPPQQPGHSGHTGYETGQPTTPTPPTHHTNVDSADPG